MDAFESLISMLLRHQGYWTMQGFKVELTKKEKAKIDRSTSPRWEVDVLAYKASENEVLAIECKSFLDSRGVVFRDGNFESRHNVYKIFVNEKLRRIVLERLKKQLIKSGACPANVKVRLGMAAGNIFHRSNRTKMEQHFRDHGWKLFDPEWIRKCLADASDHGYENDVAFIVSKLLMRPRHERFVLDVDEAGAKIVNS